MRKILGTDGIISRISRIRLIGFLGGRAMSNGARHSDMALISALPT